MRSACAVTSASKSAPVGAPIWIVFGDGSVGYSLTEFDTFVRHGVSVVAVVGNDASWSQIARDQVELLHDDVGTVLAPTRYDLVAAGFGALGMHVESADELPDALAKARAAGEPVRVAPSAIAAVATSAFPTPAMRPANSRLSTKKLRSTFELSLPAWQTGVERMLSEVLA